MIMIIIRRACDPAEQRAKSECAEGVISLSAALI